MIKVLIIDDSAFMRHMLKSMMESDPEIQVAGTARNGLEGLKKIEELHPDIVTLDIQMPDLDGLAVLEKIMALHPLPVIMLSSVDKQDAEITLRAMQLGAADFIAKELTHAPLDITHIQESIIEKIKAIAHSKASWLHHRQTASTRTPDRLLTHHRLPIDAIAIGASTGGPYALEYICSHLPANLPVPVLIAIHMPPAFTGPFVERLDRLCELKVQEAQDGEIVKSGLIYLSPGRRHLRVNRKNKNVVISLHNEPVTLYMPSVDFLFSSVAETYKNRCCGVILTGMGNDGLEGMQDIKRVEGETMAEHKDSCVVYGMPKRVIEAGLADRILPLTRIPHGLLEVLKSIPNHKDVHRAKV